MPGCDLCATYNKLLNIDTLLEASQFSAILCFDARLGSHALRDGQMLMNGNVDVFWSMSNLNLSK